LDSQSDPAASSSSTSTPGSGLSFWSTLVSHGPSSSTPAQQLIDDGLGGGQARKVDDLVVDLFPCPNNGHIFIGFSTQQTTGTGFHLAAQVLCLRCVYVRVRWCVCVWVCNALTIFICASVADPHGREGEHRFPGRVHIQLELQPAGCRGPGTFFTTREIHLTHR